MPAIPMAAPNAGQRGTGKRKGKPAAWRQGAMDLCFAADRSVASVVTLSVDGLVPAAATPLR
jgi:hypothetical protein